MFETNDKTRSGNYTIDPDGEGGVKAFSVYCDMRDKGMVGVTVISHDSESRTHVNHIIPGCGGPGCYRKDVIYFGVNAAQLAALTQVSRNCEQFIKYECNPLSKAMLGEHRVTEQEWIIGAEQLAITKFADAE